MRRDTTTPRHGWLKTVESQGLGFQQRVAPGPGGRPYWDESVHYVFTMPEVLDLEAQVEELHRMCLEVVDHVVKTKRYAAFGIPEWLGPHIAASWKRRDPHVYGRFDLSYDGHSHAKLLEYNGDTPTSLVESSVIQHHWVRDMYLDDDQWNSLHERLIDRWSQLGTTETVHFAWDASEEPGEDVMNAAYMQEVAAQAGVATKLISMQDIGWDGSTFRDLEEQPINRLFKLYPWEWVMGDPFGRHAVARQSDRSWVEPLWKMVLSNKSLLVLLWELFPDHPNLLPAFFDGPRDMTSYAVKPLFGREGASMQIVTPGGVIRTPGPYGGGLVVYQDFWPLPEFDGQRPVLGVWMVGEESAGLGIRETVGLITDDTSSFVPHRIEL